MIPKIIHYCWLSDDPIPSNLQKCMDSWKRYCPDWEIIKWDTKRFDINSVPLVKEAFENKKYAYAADYIRSYALYTMGGVYLDSDVMLYGDISKIMDSPVVSAVEYHPKRKDCELNEGCLDGDCHRISDRLKIFGVGIQAAFLAAEKGHELFSRCMDFYKTVTLSEVLENHYTAPTVLASRAERYGYIYKNEEQFLEKGIHLYPTSKISHFDQFTKDSIAVHFCAGSWVDKNFLQKCLQFVKAHKTTFLIYTFLKNHKII